MMALWRPIACRPIHGASHTEKWHHVGVVRMSAVSSPPPSKNPENFQHHSVEIPRTEPFSRGKISRWMKEPSLIEKAENAIMDHCSRLEGEESYKCWEAFFEFQNMKKESEVRGSTPNRSLARLENLVRQSCGVKDLIDNVNMVAKASRMHKDDARPQGQIAGASSADDVGKAKRRPFPEPDGLPKTPQELEEEEKSMMPDSPYTKLLRSKGWFPAWYSPHPDHETD